MSSFTLFIPDFLRKHSFLAMHQMAGFTAARAIVNQQNNVDIRHFLGFF